MKKFNYQLPINSPLQLPEQIDQDQLGQLLLGLISQAVDKGLDHEAALLSAGKSLIAHIQVHEAR